MAMRLINRGIIKVEVQTLTPEKFLNYLWNKRVELKNIQKVNLTTFTFLVRLGDYNKVEETAKRLGARCRVLSKKGLAFYMVKFKRNVALGGGIILFLSLLYFLSQFIWSIEIVTENYIAPYEIRRFLYGEGIKPGIGKRIINTTAIEDKLQKEAEGIMWVRVRIEGSKLRVKIAEKTLPPKIQVNDQVGDVVASRDGEIIRIYTNRGTASVAPGELVKKGQVLIRGVEGKEGQEYQVPAEGYVFAKTFYEGTKVLEDSISNEVYTGREDRSLYINLKGIKIYLQKPTKNFISYDRIESNNNFIAKTIYKEKENKIADINMEEAIDNAVIELEREQQLSMDKSSSIIDKSIFVDELENGVRVRVLFIVEENIAEKAPQE